MSEIKLKPCPFCGSANVKIYNLSGLREVACVDCCSCSSLYHTEAEAAEAWNRRSEARPKGEWVQSEQPDAVVCSNCRDCYCDTSWFPAMIRNFCPKCGADMRKSVAKQQQNGGIDKK